MKVLFLILNNPDYLEDVLAVFTNNEVRGATILESQGMGSTIVNNNIKDLPLFGSLNKILKNSHVYNKTIFSVIKDEEKLKRVIRDLNEIQKDKESGIRLVFTLPIDEIYFS